VDSRSEWLLQLDDWVQARHTRCAFGIVLALSVFYTCFSVWIESRFSRASTCEAVEIDFPLGICTCAPRATESAPGKRTSCREPLAAGAGGRKRVQREGLPPVSLGRFGSNNSMRRISSEGATRIASESLTIAVKDGL
jgi:hypothetical protein